MTDHYFELTDVGLYCRRYNFYLDPQQPVEHAIVSHGHGDHAVPGSTHVYCTAPTRAVMELRYKKTPAKTFHTKAYHENFSIGSVRFTFYPAGHILGSAQVLIEMDGKRILYTGDFKLEFDATAESFEFVKADILITETTFASQLVQHPDAVEEIKKLNTLPDGNIIFGAYALGKAQRITQLINEHCPRYQVLVHYSVLPIHKLYEQFGVNMGKWSPYDRKVMKHTKNNIYIVPPLTFSSYRHAKGAFKVFASGWSNLQRGCDQTMFISDHADWNQLLRLIAEVEPQEIQTLHGKGDELKAFLGDRYRVTILN